MDVDAYKLAMDEAARNGAPDPAQAIAMQLGDARAHAVLHRAQAAGEWASGNIGD